VDRFGFRRSDLERQVARLLRVSPFSSSPRLRRFLNFVVWKTYNENPSTIRAYEIAVDAFGKGADFDPNDPYIRNIARITREALDEYYSDPTTLSATLDPIQIQIPKGNYKAVFSETATGTKLSANEKLESQDFAYAPISPFPDETIPDETIPNKTIPEKPADLAKRLDKVSREFSTVETRSHSEAKIKQTLSAKSGTTGPKSGDDSADPTKQTERVLPLLAIIPFTCFNGEQTDNDPVGEILAAEIISSLAPSRQMDVISRLTTSKFRNRSIERILLGEILHADYLLTGSYQVSNNTVLLNLELSEATTTRREVIWTELSRIPLDSIYTSRSATISDLVLRISQSLVQREIELVDREPLGSLNLHTALLVGTNLMHCSPEKLFNRAMELFKAIHEHHPDHPELNTLIAQWYLYRIHRGGGWSAGDDDKLKKLAWKHCEIALDTNPCHVSALTTYGLLHTQFRKAPELGMDYYRTAERFNPNEPLTQAYIAAAHSYFGHGKEAVQAAERAVRLSPFDPQLHLFETCLAAGYLSADDLVKAEVHAKRAFELNPSHTSNLRALISILVERGQLEEAKQHARSLLKLDPGFTTGSYQARSPNANFEIGKRIANNLRTAGIPE